MEENANKIINQGKDTVKKEVKNELIKDSEFEYYINTIYDQKLEEELLRTSYGKRIKYLEQMKVGISIEDVIQKYKDRNGITLDSVGNVIFYEESAKELLTESIVGASRKIGFDISNLNKKQIEAVISNPEIVSDVNALQDIGAETKQTPEFIAEGFLAVIGSKLNIDENDDILKLDDIGIIMKEYGFSESETNNYKIKTNENAIDTYIQTESDVDLLVHGYEMWLRVKNKSDYGEVTSSEQQEFKNLIKNYQDSKYWVNFIGEDGEVDFDKAMKFMGNFINKRESFEIDSKLNQFTRKGLKKFFKKGELSKEDNEELVKTLIRTENHGDDSQKKLAIMIAKSYGIDIIDAKGHIDKAKIELLGKNIFGKDFNYNEMLENVTFGGDSTISKLMDIEKGIKNGYTIEDGKLNADSINESNRKAKKSEVRICSAKEAIVYEVLNSANTFPLRNYYKNPENAKQIVVLFCKFREEEINTNKVRYRNQSRQGKFDGRSINSGKTYTTSGIIKKFIMEHPKEFKEYIDFENGKLKTDKVMEAYNSNLSLNRDVNNILGYNQIKSRVSEIEEQEFANRKELKDMSQKIKAAKDANETRELSDYQKKEIFEKVGSMSSKEIDTLSTEMIENLKQIDEVLFKKIFKDKKVERNVGSDSMKAIYFSAARLVVKGIYLFPKMFVSKAVRDRYIPRIGTHIVSGTKRIGKLIINQKNNQDKPEKKGLFNRISGLIGNKKNKLLLPAEEQKGENVTQENQNKDQQTFAERIQYNVNDNARKTNETVGEDKEVKKKDSNQISQESREDDGR